jgi:hypothetical protein
MPYAVDGNNVAGTLGRESGDSDRQEVVRRLLPWTRGRRRVVLVFDGPPDSRLARRYGSLELRWSGRSEADDLILHLIRDRPADWRVVTDDRQLAIRCRDLGARHIPVPYLLRLVAASVSDRREAEPVVDVEEWEAFFGRGREPS